MDRSFEIFHKFVCDPQEAESNIALCLITSKETLKLDEIRRKWAVWLTPELEAALRPFEGKIRSMGAKAWLVNSTEAMDGRARIVNEMYQEFAEGTGMAQWGGKQISGDLAVANIIAKLRQILGVDALTHLRSEFVKRALENLKKSS